MERGASGLWLQDRQAGDSRGHQHYAASEDKAAQCREYGRYRQWAWEACGLAEHELKEQLETAVGLHEDRLGSGGLPQAFRHHHHAAGGHRMTLEATPLCFAVWPGS